MLVKKSSVFNRSMIRTIFLLFALSASVLNLPVHPNSESDQKCGYDSCHPLKKGFVNVHIVPHTHDDVGWLKTVDQYYYGSRTNIQNAGVENILDSVVEALHKDPNRRFIYVETAFFWKWWIKQHDTVKALVRRYVNNGQLEFIGGGWSMNDEAATNYHSTIDQMTWGFQKLNETFGACGRPKIGWQIDPFGHSREQASIFAQLGFDGVLLGRIDYEDKMNRWATKTPEMIWKSSNNLEKSEIFTSVLYNNYAPPKGFCFDILCTDDPIIDNKKSPDYNVDQKINDFFAYLDNMTAVYTTDNLLITMGEDFQYQDAQVWFKNLDKLIMYANERQSHGSKYNLIYSTPSCYIKAVQEDAKAKNLVFPVKSDDFFPYASDPHAYWTGFFTSRPTSKRFEREGNNYLQVCKQLYALTDLGPEDRVDLNALREAMGIMQHHDAITGTEKQHVADDYARILTEGFNECEFITATALSNLVTNKSKINEDAEPAPAVPFTSCLLTNISSCSISETQKNFVVTIYNPLSREVSKHVRLPVLGSSYSVKDAGGKDLETQIIPTPEEILKIPGRKSEATVELVFLAEKLPPLGFKSFFIQRKEGNDIIQFKDVNELSLAGISVKVDKATGLLTEMTMNGVTLPISQEFLFYNGFVGDNKEFANRSSGAYIFRPNGTSPTSITDTVKVKAIQGSILSEIHQTFNEWVSQVIRIYKNDNLVEFDWLVGPIPIDGPNGKEIITRFKTNLKTESTFYTDSNGREVLKRVRDFRPTWKLHLQEPVAGNYYPITSKILLKDATQNVEFSVLTDRAQGGSSLKDGQVELMVHRNCLHDDAFGVGEALNEEAFDTGLVARGSHFVVFGKANETTGKSIAAQERDVAQRKLLSAWTFLAPTNETSLESYKSKFAMEYSGLKKSLPDNVQILTLEPWVGFSFLLRLEHVLEKDEDKDLSKPVQVDLKNLFTPFEITSIKETTLGANQWLEKNKRLDFPAGESIEHILDGKLNDDKIQSHLREIWMRNNDEYSNYVKRDISMNDNLEDLVINLTPMQIRTFVIEFKKN